jgi:hypothetical protein
MTGLTIPHYTVQGLKSRGKCLTDSIVRDTILDKDATRKSPRTNGGTRAHKFIRVKEY